jgi:predicted transcriptional regulator
MEIIEVSKMNALKETMVKIIESQPDDSTYDEILRELAFARMIEKGIADSDAGRTITNNDMKQRIESWQK